MDKKVKPEKIFHSYNIQFKSNDEETREIEAVASYQTKDRDGDIVFLDGLDITNFKKNKGPILWSHDSLAPPLAKVTKVWVEGKKLLMKMDFATAEEYGFADTIYKLIKGGYINSLSIGFKPDWQVATFNEKNNGYEFKKAELLETSIVNVPANAGAKIITRSLTDAVKKNVIDDVEKEEVELMIDELLEKNCDVAEKSEQINTNTNDELEVLKIKVHELEERLQKFEKSDDTTDEIYHWLFEEDLDLGVSKKVDHDEQLINDVLKEIGIE